MCIAHLLLQSAIEDTLARINLLGGVEGYVVVDNAVSCLTLLSTLCMCLARRGRGPSFAVFCCLSCTSVLQGTILRQSKSLSPGDAAIYAKEMAALTAKARHVVRDLNPKVSSYEFDAACQPGRPPSEGVHRSSIHACLLSYLQNDLEIFRLRGREREILTAPGPDDAFLVIVIQRWTAAAPEPAAAGLPAGPGMAAAAAGGAGAGGK